ncbi:hypothetical protein [Helicobacter vulpis]|uniref:hypothetical protein n=1 Tax=Helicobacter vulpis TaxID=2316076 RepID=UPI001F204C3E|nr:hypothetical protein [Helicobacter vulpis]
MKKLLRKIFGGLKRYLENCLVRILHGQIHVLHDQLERSMMLHGTILALQHKQLYTHSLSVGGGGGRHPQF